MGTVVTLHRRSACPLGLDENLATTQVERLHYIVKHNLFNNVEFNEQVATNLEYVGILVYPIGCFQ